MSSAKLARRPLAPARNTSKAGVPRDHETIRERALLEHRFELHDGHRGQWRKVVRIYELQQILSKVGERGVDPQLDTSGKKRKSLKQSFHIRIRDIRRVHAESSGDLRKLSGEFHAHLSDVLQFTIVVTKQARIHD